MLILQLTRKRSVAYTFLQEGKLFLVPYVLALRRNFIESVLFDAVRNKLLFPLPECTLSPRLARSARNLSLLSLHLTHLCEPSLPTPFLLNLHNLHSLPSLSLLSFLGLLYLRSQLRLLRRLLQLVTLLPPRNTSVENQ